MLSVSRLAPSPGGGAPRDCTRRPPWSAGLAPTQWFGVDAIRVCPLALKTVVSKVGVPKVPPRGSREKIPEPLTIIFCILSFKISMLYTFYHVPNILVQNYVNTGF